MGDNPQATTPDAPSQALPEAKEQPKPITETDNQKMNRGQPAAEDPNPKTEDRQRENIEVAKVAVKEVVSGEGSEPENGNLNHYRSDSASSENKTPSGLKKTVHWSPELMGESPSHAERSNPYVTNAPAAANPSSFAVNDTMSSVRDVLGRWGRMVGEATKKAEVLAGNTWQHLKTGPSFADATMGRIAQGTKVLAEGGYEKIFQNTFETVPEEQLQNSYACYLSTSAGPVMGTLYVSTAKLAYCSDNPLSYKVNSQTEWSYYKVVMPLHQLKAVNPSSSRANPAEKYVQIISVDNHEFWFMGFLNYDGAVEILQGILQQRSLQSV